MSHISMRVLAEQLGLTPGTVSKALSGRPGPSAATTARVRALAERLDFRPDPLLARQGAARRHGRSLRLIAVISARPAAYRQRSERLATALADDAHLLGYRLQLCRSEDAAGLGACGLLIDGHETLATDAIARSGLPMVQIGGRHSLPCARVAVDPFAAVLRCAEAAHAAGFQRVGCAPCVHAPENDDDRLRHAAALLTCPHIPPFRGALSDSAGFARWFARYRPEAVIGFAALQRRWLPKGTPFACLHVQDRDASVTGVPITLHDIGRVAVRMLDQALRSGDHSIGPALVLLPPAWNAGHSLLARGHQT